MRDFIRKLFGLRRRTVVRSREPLTERETRGILCVGPEEPWLVCVLQMIEKMREDCTAELTGVECTTELRTYYAGAVEHLQMLEDFLHSEREEAMRRRESFEEDAEK
jgi:hypothetical protein